jgi:hypothetical protein
VTTQNVGSYTANITDILTTQTSLTGSLSAFGISSKDSFSSGEKTTNSTDWTVTIQSSYTATAQSSTTVTGNLDDHHGSKGDGSLLSYRPRVRICQDNMFGSFMFVDPDAPHGKNFNVVIDNSNITLAANSLGYVKLTPNFLNKTFASPVALSVTASNGVTVNSYPATVDDGQAAFIWLAVPLGTPAGTTGAITITATPQASSWEAQSVSVNFTTEACVPTTCLQAGYSCGALRAASQNLG